jgi:hypothetical protein
MPGCPHENELHGPEAEDEVARRAGTIHACTFFWQDHVTRNQWLMKNWIADTHRLHVYSNYARQNGTLSLSRHVSAPDKAGRDRPIQRKLASFYKS